MFDITRYYCYEQDCPGRTKEEPWPKSDGVYKSIKIIPESRKPYYRRKYVCKHCGNPMTATRSLSEEE
jgi:hypothetical protein